MQISTFRVIAALTAFLNLCGLALSGCATTPAADSATAPAGTFDAKSDSTSDTNLASGPQRDLTPQEKKAIVDAVAPSLRDPASAHYKWAKFPAVVTSDSVNYCATVDAKSPYAAYNGNQAYIVEAKVTGGHVTSAVMGLIAGGKDFTIVSGMCAKYGLDPRKSS